MARRPGLGSWRSTRTALVVYPLLALLSFPTFETLLAGEHGLGFRLDVFDLPRTGVLADWLANGPTLWNAHLTAGNALLAQHALSPYAPDVALAFLVGPFGGYAIVAWAMAAVAGISMHLFLRDSLRLGTGAVVGGAAIYGFAFWHFSYGFAALAPPLVLWLMDRAFAARGTTWAYVLATALVGAFLLYDGLSQVVLIAAAMQLGWIVATSPRRRRKSAAGIWVVVWALALGMSGPVLLSQLVMLPSSQRTIWDLQALFDARPIEAAWDTLQYYSAVLFGAPVAPGLGSSPGRYGLGFVGALGLPILVAGMVAARRGRRGRYLLLLLIAVPAVDLVAVLATPLQDQLGALKSFQFVRVRHLLPFALAANTAIGINVISNAILRGRPVIRGRAWRRLAILAAIVPVAVTLVVGVRHVVSRRFALLHGDEVALGWLLVTAGLAIGIGGLAVLAIALARRHGMTRRAPAFLVLVVAIVAGEGALQAHGERLIGADLGTWADSVAVTPAAQFLLDQPGHDVDRVMSFGGVANRMAAAGLLQADGYQSIYPLTYHEIFGALIDPQLSRDPAMSTYYRKWGNRAVTFGPNVDPDLVRLLGVRWLVVEGPDVPTVPRIVPRFQSGDDVVYEVTGVIPRAFVAPSLVVEPDRAAAVARLTGASVDELLTSAVVVRGEDAGLLSAAAGSAPARSPAGGPSAVSAHVTATIVRYTPDRVEVDVAPDGPGTLVLTDVMAPGWEAERDGNPVAIGTVDVAFRGVPVDASSRHVVFRYLPTFTMAGFGLAFGSLLLALGWAALLRHRGRSATNDQRQMAQTIP